MESSPKNTFEKRLPIFLVIAVILLCCLVAIVGAIYYYYDNNSSKGVFLPLPGEGTPYESHIYSDEDLATAIAYVTNDENCKAAMPLLEGVILNMENNGDAYYYRGYCRHLLTDGQNIEQIYRADLLLALEDVDEAIVLGMTDASILPGDPYFLRSNIFSSLLGSLTTPGESLAYRELILENLKMASALGTTDPFAHRWTPLAYFFLDRCEEGFAEVNRIRQQEGLSAPPSATLYNIEAHGYVCIEDFDKALEYVDKGLSLSIQPERVYFRAIILYHLGRFDESLTTLDQLIEERPNYTGMRYYLRALVHYELGERELAEADLQMGSGNTWGGAGLDAYVLGLMALDDGNKELAVQYLQEAEANLPFLYHPLLPKIQEHLASLGVEPLPRESILEYISTPMPQPPLILLPEYEVNDFGFQLPPHPVLVDMHKGTGPLELFTGFYPVFHFSPNQLVDVESVQKLTLHIQTEPEANDMTLNVMLWQPTTGEWSIIITMPRDDIEVEDPEIHVDNIGNIHLAVYPPSRPVQFENIWLTLEVIDTNGSQVIVDIDQQP